MTITSTIPNGSGRVRRVGPDAYEIELIAYSKGSRYFCVEADGGAEGGTVEITLVPDRWFRIKTFPYKCEADVWVCDATTRNWQRVQGAEATPEAVRFHLTMKAGARYLISSEPPYRYIDTTQEIFAIAAEHRSFCPPHYLGASIEHRPIFGLRITETKESPGEETHPVIHISAGEHASESAGEEIARGMLYYLLSEEGAAARQSYIFDIVLNTNPDGNYHGWHQYNLRDWHGHNYCDTVDRSWHHEFVPYLLGVPEEYSSETIALMEWIKLTRPACYFSMHSWEGQGGTLGAYHTASDTLEPKLAEAIEGLLEISKRVSHALGFDIHNYATHSDGIHLGQLLMKSGAAVAYLPEGNYMLGREKLQAYGAGLLKGALEDRRVIQPSYDRSRWDALATPKSANPQERLTSSCP